MTTRTMHLNNLENKLKKALTDLKEAGELSERLLAERNDNEHQIRQLKAKNASLRDHLTTSRSNLDEAQADIDKLQCSIHSYQDLHAELDLAKDRAEFLQQQLREAHNQLLELNREKEDSEFSHTASLQDELQFDCSCDSNDSIVIKSSKKIVKNITFNKIKHKSRKNFQLLKSCLKRQTKKYKYVNLLQLNGELQQRLDGAREEYDTIKHQLAEVDLQLQVVSGKYAASQVELQEVSSALAEMLELQSSNRRLMGLIVEDEELAGALSSDETRDADTYIVDVTRPVAPPAIRTHGCDHQATSGKCTRGGKRRGRRRGRAARREASHARPAALAPSAAPRSSLIAPTPLPRTVWTVPPCSAPTAAPRTAPTLKNAQRASVLQNTFVYSDKVGVGFGPILNNCLEQNVTNICCPNLSFDKIVTKISKDHVLFNEQTTVVIMVGNHANVTRASLNDSLELLQKIHNKKKCKFILLAFPYCSNLSREHNECIYNINLHLTKFTNRHSDVILFFDINKFIHSFKLTQDTMYLSRQSKCKIATLVAYNIVDTDKFILSKTITTPISSITNKHCLN